MAPNPPIIPPRIGNIYMDKVCPNRYVEMYQLFQMDVAGDTYHLKRMSSNFATSDVVLVTLNQLNTFYQIRVNYVGHK